MKKMTATLCLTIAVLPGSADVSWGTDFQMGLTAYSSGNYATALWEWKPLAEQGDADAQSNLGTMYAEGNGISQDNKTAVMWFTRAAEQGNADAQNNLGFMYGNGRGVPQDYIRAHMWWNIAASSGNKYAISGRDAVSKQMTPADISAAQKLARECVRKKYKEC